MDEDTKSRLMDGAQEAAGRAFAPYSGFSVGAAILSQNGRIHTGCNVESASFGLTCCAERVAVFGAVAAGERAFSAIAVWAPKAAPCMPCGACRQVLSEFALPGFWVLTENALGEIEAAALSDLLPRAFGPPPPTFRGAV